ncbi:MAG: hypothetical protein IKY83_00865 [Proteobacteria bacterium]|nr:hypothetical protein [Pseudomonadota bacterium]
MKKELAYIVSICASVLLSGCEDYYIFKIESTKVEVVVEIDCSTEGETRYYPTDNNLECLIQSCHQNKWDTTGSCKDSDGNIVSCALNTNSDESVEYQCGECQDDQSTCSDNSSNTGLVKKCVLGHWDSQICLEDASCNDNKCGKCKNGVSRCIDNSVPNASDAYSDAYIEICKNGNWEHSINCDDASCNSEKTECGNCINGEQRCITDPNSNEEYGLIEQCIFGDWKKLYECRSDASDEKRVSCLGKACTDANSCAPSCGECANGKTEIREVDNICSTYVCTDGTWVNSNQDTSSPVSCIYSIDGTKQMGKCLNGKRNCDADTLQICSNGQYEPLMQCKDCAISEDNNVLCTTDCLSNDTICNDNSSHVGVLSKCENGISTINPCPNNNMCNSDLPECGQCKFEEKSCRDNDMNVGIIQICQNGAFTDISDQFCQDNNSCDGTQCGLCHNGDTKCEEGDSNAFYTTCEQGVWAKSIPCSDVAVSCTDNKCGLCRDGDLKYLDMPNQSCQRFICKNGQWTMDNYTCPDQHSCKIENGNATCGNCTNYSFSGTVDGVIRKLYTCLDGKQETNETCTLEYYGEYIACKWRDTLFAPNKDDKIECYNKKNSDGMLIGYYRDNDKACENSVSCHVSGINQTTCGDCLELATQCIGSTPQTCINGKWVDDPAEWNTQDNCPSQ